MDGADKDGRCFLNSNPRNRWQRVERGSWSARAGTRWGTPGLWLQRFSHPNPKHTWNAYKTQGLGSDCPPRSRSWSLVGLVLEPKPEPCFMLYPAD